MTDDLGGWTRDQGAELLLKGNPGIEPDLRVYNKLAKDGTFVRAMVGTIPGHGKHLSISGMMRVGKYLQPGRYPTWDEIKDARYRFVDDRIEMVMHLPPKSEYVNVHQSCFHLHELVDPKKVQRLVDRCTEAERRMQLAFEHARMIEAKIAGLEAELKLTRASV